MQRYALRKREDLSLSLSKSVALYDRERARTGLSMS